MCGNAALQAKPFINEAHVFNDAGLSFDVWPPRTGSPASDAPPKPTAITSADSSLHPEEHICLVDADTAAEKASCLIGDDDVAAVEGAASSSNGSSSGMAAASEVVGSDVGISRGYLLALKLWEEAIVTVNARHRSSASLGTD